MTRRLVRNRAFEGVIGTVLDDVIALLGAEYGNVQLPIGDELAIVAQRGLSAEFLRTFWRVKRDDGSACGRALALGVPVGIPDIEKDHAFATFRRDARDAGFRAVQSTPMFTKDERLFGIVSTHFVSVHQPTPIEMQTLKEYGGIAAEYAFMLLEESYQSIASRAQQMSAELYAQTLAPEASDRSARTPRRTGLA
jgi:GAF domain-containing protein